MSEALTLRGVLKGHSDWVTALATTSEDPGMIISASRDKTCLVWTLTNAGGDGEAYGYPRRALKGHSHFVEDVAISSDGMFALSGSWDNTMRLWNLDSGETRNQFVGHKNDVLSVAFSPKNSHIISGSRDKTINLWNTIGQLKYTMTDNGHTGWVSCVRFSPDERKQTFVSAGWASFAGNWTSTGLPEDLLTVVFDVDVFVRRHFRGDDDPV